MVRRRILIVEDEFFIAENCASDAEEAGFEVAGPYLKLGDVPQELSGISGAIIDLKVGGVLAYALIDRLLEMNIPITLYTGYDVHCCPKKYAELSRVIKPLPCVEAVKDLMRQLATLNAQQSSALNFRLPARADRRPALAQALTQNEAMIANSRDRPA
jgi:hypothetical protein